MNVTRRFFLKSSAALAATYCGITPLRLLADAGAGPEQPRHGPSQEQDARGRVPARRHGRTQFRRAIQGPRLLQGCASNIALAEPGKDGGVVDLDGFFGLHPRAAALAPLFQKGQAVALQAVGYDLNTRSHFEEQDTWETGVSGNTLNVRRLAQPPPAHQPGPRTHPRRQHRRHSLPRILRGKAPAFSVRGITDLGIVPRQEGQGRLR